MVRSLLITSVCLCSATLLQAQLASPPQGGGQPSEQGQGTQSIEDMFENVARAKAERSKESSPVGSANGQSERGVISLSSPERATDFPSRVPFPRQGFPQNSLRSTLRPRQPLTARPVAIRQSLVVQSAGFQDDLRRLDGHCANLAQLLRDDSLRNPAIRKVLPVANRLSSEARMVFQQGTDNSVASDVVESYGRLDRDWRQLEFQLRGLGGVSGDAFEAMHQCEQLVSRMSRQLALVPQFDRGKLRNLLLVVGSKLETLGDDLRFADIADGAIADGAIADGAIADGARHELARALRLLRQDALNLVDRVEVFQQQDVVLGLRNLNNRWWQIAPTLRGIADAHVQHRVQGVTECFRRAHALLWIDLPTDARVLPAIASRLVVHCRLVVAVLNESLANPDQLVGTEPIMRVAQQLLGDSEALSAQISRSVSAESSRRVFLEVERGWSELRKQLVDGGLVGRRMVAAIDDELLRLRTSLRIERNTQEPVDQRHLLRTAAAIESTAEFIDADFQRYSSLLTPLTFRTTALSASSAFLQSAKLFHQLLDQQADAVTVIRAGAAMQENWKRLSQSLSQVQLHGVSPQRARNLMQDQRELVEYMSEISTALSP
ncbi:hypothetical protein N9F76_01215 [bacterium]|nr:hypothetical protein [bacterium]